MSEGMPNSESATFQETARLNEWESKRHVGLGSMKVLASLFAGLNPTASWQVPHSLHGTLRSGSGQKRRSCTPTGQLCDTTKFLTGEEPGECVCVTEVYCNREIDLKRISAIGFDMDFTLASYTTAFDLLAFEGAKRKLVEELGYPHEVLNFTYVNTTFPRGVMIDKKLGNFIKADRHKYVRVAMHGRSHILSAEERKNIYRPDGEGVPEFSGNDFVKMDTLFHVVDAELFAQLVDLKDSQPELLQKSYKKLYKDVRASVDLCHRDGTIKREVALDPFKYVVRDPDLIPTLKAHKRDGKKLFLLTNSEWNYTNVVMNHLWGNGPDAKDFEWTSLFDVIICFSRKPRFFMKPFPPLHRVNPIDGSLENTTVTDADIGEYLAQGKIFEGGCHHDLHSMLGTKSGESILYVGDHMYSDVLKTKRVIGWRTCLIIPELEQELTTLDMNVALRDEMRDLREVQMELDEELDCALIQNRLESVKEAQQEHDEATAALKAKLNEYHALFHPIWGQMFGAGYQDSLLAKQIAAYACLYTSKVGNFRSISPRRHFRTRFEDMPHELL